MTVDSGAWVAVHAAGLIGLPACAAEQEASAAGLRSRIAGPDVMLTLDYRPDRVTLITDAADVVTEIRAG